MQAGNGARSAVASAPCLAARKALPSLRETVHYERFMSSGDNFLICALIDPVCIVKRMKHLLVSKGDILTFFAA